LKALLFSAILLFVGLAQAQFKTVCEVAGTNNTIVVSHASSAEVTVKISSDIQLGGYVGAEEVVPAGEYEGTRASLTNEDNFRVTLLDGIDAENLFGADCNEGAELYMYSRHGKGGIIFSCAIDSSPGYSVGTQIYCNR
jgi:hypothetical protein